MQPFACSVPGDKGMRPAESSQDRAQLRAVQWSRLKKLLDEILPRNRFYAQKFAGLQCSNIRRLEDLRRVPFTTKDEVLADQKAHPPYGSNLTYPLAHYCRMHQTSGTTGQPLRWLDTAASWEQMLGCWETIFDIVGITAADRLLFPFSFGPFLGFWTAFEAGCRHGCLCLPGGGLSTMARLHMLQDNQATVVLCTPTYALHLTEAWRASRREPDVLSPFDSVRAVIVAGEPGGCIPATRARIEESWRAGSVSDRRPRVFDHSGMTEVGPMAIECPENPGGLHILEGDYLAEVVDADGDAAVPPGQVGELVVTTLGRLGSPLIRYRTGDLVRIDPEACPCGRTFTRLAGGILGRTDNMIHVRGNNVYPSALEDVIRRFPEVAEFRIEVARTAALTELRIEVEPEQNGQARDLPERVCQAIRDELLFRADVVLVQPGTLPRFEMKSQRICYKDCAKPQAAPRS